jgi:ribosome maturation factor RimP
VKGKKEQALIEVLEQVAEANGYELVDLEFAGTARARIVRVYVDKQDGINIDDIAAANAWVDAAIEANEPFSTAYTLEVSSPGIDRPLRTLEHFARFEGEEAKLQTEPIEGRGNWTGTLAGVEEDTILLALSGETYHIPHIKIKKAHLKGTIDFKRVDSKIELELEFEDDSETETEGTEDVI